MVALDPSYRRDRLNGFEAERGNEKYKLNIMNKKILFILSNPRWLFAIGVGLLALHPLIWLINTWISPAYQSNGFLVVLLVGGLFLWSVTSRRDVP